MTSDVPGPKVRDLGHPLNWYIDDLGLPRSKFGDLGHPLNWYIDDVGLPRSQSQGPGAPTELVYMVIRPGADGGDSRACEIEWVVGGRAAEQPGDKQTSEPKGAGEAAGPAQRRIAAAHELADARDSDGIGAGAGSGGMGHLRA